MMPISNPSICFLDFLYPYACSDRRWAIVDILTNAIQKYTEIVPEFMCIPTDEIYDKDIYYINTNVTSSCIAFTGMEMSSNTQLSDIEMFTIGPYYNFSRDFVIPYQVSKFVPTAGDGWKFFNPLDWVVWCLFFTVIVVVTGIQIMMKKISVDASPTLDQETGAEVASRSILSSIGYSRLYGGNSGIIARHILSCAMACFSAVMVSLYCSNLVNFFYTATNDYRVKIPLPNDVRVHPALKDLISPEMFGVYTNNTQSNLELALMMPNAVYYSHMIPVVPRSIGDGFRNSTTSLVSLGGYYTIYRVVFVKTLELITGKETLKNIEIEINKQLDLYHFNNKQVLDFPDTDSERIGEINIDQVWGVFLILLVGYVSSILFRIFCTKKTGLSNIYLFKHPKHENAVGRRSSVSRREGSVTSVNTDISVTVVTVPSIPESIYVDALADMSEIDLTSCTQCDRICR